MYGMIRTVTTHPVRSKGFTKGWPAVFGWTGPNKNELFKLFSFQKCQIQTRPILWVASKVRNRKKKHASKPESIEGELSIKFSNNFLSIDTKQNKIQEKQSKESELRGNKSLALTFLQRYAPQVKQQIPSLLAEENNAKYRLFLYQFCMRIYTNRNQWTNPFINPTPLTRRANARKILK